MESTAPIEGPAARGIRRMGLLLFLLASLLPYHGCRAFPGEFEDPPTSDGHYDRSDPGLTGAYFFEWFLRDKVLGREFGAETALFHSGGDSDDLIGLAVFMALPLWAAALLLVRGDRPRTRWTIGLLLWLAIGTLFLAALTDGFETGPDFFAASWFGNAPKSVILSIAGGLLLLRPRDRWEIRDVEGTVSSQALLGIGVCLATPVLRAWGWAMDEGHTVSAVARALWINYRIGFWLALAALALIAAPLYFSEESLRGLYDRCRPWRPRSSTPTPTSTSTGSTPTGTPSSTAPGPPGSSPS